MSGDARPDDAPLLPQQPPPVPTRSVPPARHAPAADEQRCDLCGAPLLDWHCRLICTSCGFQRDCSDP